MVKLILRLESTKYRYRILYRWLLCIYRLESSLKSLIRLYILPVLIKSRRADCMKLSTGKSWLDEVRCICRAFGSASTYDRMKLIDEKNDLPFTSGDFLDDTFKSLFELTAELSTRNQ